MLLYAKWKHKDSCCGAQELGELESVHEVVYRLRVFKEHHCLQRLTCVSTGFILAI